MFINLDYIEHSLNMYDFSIDTLSMARNLAYRKLFFAQIKINFLLFCVIHNSYFSFLFCSSMTNYFVSTCFSIYNEFVRRNKATKIKHCLMNLFLPNYLNSNLKISLFSFPIDDFICDTYENVETTIILR